MHFEKLSAVIIDLYVFKYAATDFNNIDTLRHVVFILDCSVENRCFFDVTFSTNKQYRRHWQRHAKTRTGFPQNMNRKRGTSEYLN